MGLTVRPLPVLHSKNGNTWIFSDDGSLNDGCRTCIGHYVELHVNTSIKDDAISYQKFNTINRVNWINPEIIRFSNDTDSIVCERRGESVVGHNLEDKFKITWHEFSVVRVM